MIQSPPVRNLYISLVCLLEILFSSDLPLSSELLYASCWAFEVAFPGFNLSTLWSSFPFTFRATLSISNEYQHHTKMISFKTLCMISHNICRHHYLFCFWCLSLHTRSFISCSLYALGDPFLKCIQKHSLHLVSWENFLEVLSDHSYTISTYVVWKLTGSE